MTAIGTIPVLFATGNHAARPAASAVGKGGLYSCTTHSLVYQTDGSSWSTWANLAGTSTGTVTTVEEVDGSPTNSAVTKIVFPNGTLGIVGTVATYTPGAVTLDLSGLTIERSVQAVSDYVAAYDASAADERGIPIGYLGLSRQHTIIQSECMASSTTPTTELFEGGLLGFVSGTSAALAAGTSTANHPGVLSLGTGSTTTGRCALGNQQTTIILLGGGKVRVAIMAKIPTLSDGTNTFTIRMGLQTAFANDGTDGVFFRYTNGVNSGKWQRVTRAASVETATDTTITADTNWHTFEFEVNAAGTSVEFFIDGTSVGTNAANVPTAGVSPIPASIVKSAGGTSRTLEIDAYLYALEFTTAR